MNTHGAALSAWIERLNALDPARMELGLDRVSAVLARMGLGAPPFRVATVGGTNGKGSVVGYLSALLGQTGLGPVGAYTSPHVRDYRERIVVDDAMVDAGELTSAFEAVEQARGEIHLSYFEFTTLAALEVFRRAGVRHAVLEVGLGGRLDAVNALDADAAAVVSVGLDHQQWLGDDRDSIGVEKAGIFRAGRPAVIGDRDPPVGLLDGARERNAELRLIGRDFAARDSAGGWCYHGRGTTLEGLPEPAMQGRFQRDNAAIALALFEALVPGNPPHRTQVANALRHTKLPGRLELRHGEVEWLLDVAHNPQSAAMLSDWLARATRRRTWAVFAMLADKDAASVAALVAPRVQRWFLATLPGSRGQMAEELARKTEEVIPDPVLCDNIATAVTAAEQAARGGDRIVIFGSFHTVEEALVSGLVPDREVSCVNA